MAEPEPNLELELHAQDEVLIIKLSVPFKEAVGHYADQQNMSMSEAVKIIVSAVIDYDYMNEPHPKKTGRPTSYATPVERRNARIQQSQTRRTIVRDAYKDLQAKKGSTSEETHTHP